MILRWLITAGLLLSLCLEAGSPAFAEIKGARAREIEAAFLLQFSKYVTWPAGTFEESEGVLIVGILGRDPFGSVLDKIARSSTANGRPVEIRRFDDLSVIADSHILFVTSSYLTHMTEIVEALKDSPVLLVGDSHGFLQYGVINFVMVEKKIRFNISRPNCGKFNLKISSKLLKVAHRIE